jgi:hypothetical protein
MTESDRAGQPVPAEYVGKRVRLTGFVKAEQVTGSAGLWMRVDGPGGYSSGKPAQMLAFDNMQDRPITGTTDWGQYQVVLDVTSTAANLAFGILLAEVGHVWLDGVNLEVVDTTVPTTGGSAAPAPVPLHPGAQCPSSTVDLSTWVLAGEAPQKYKNGLDSSVTCSGSPSVSLESR